MTLSPGIHTLNISSPAKINLFLGVTGKRPDGYHELISLMCPISLTDNIRITFGGDGIRVICIHPDVPEDDTNLAHRAASIFCSDLSKKFNQKKFGVSIEIEKNIPVGAGLGGGSSNAATIINGLNRWCGTSFSLDERIQMGLKVGSDVPFFIFGKPALVSGIGEKIEPYGYIPSAELLLVTPRINVSSRKVYKNLNLGLTKCGKNLKSFFLKKPAFDFMKHLCNDLETSAIEMFPEIGRVKKELWDEGALGALMSGSGSSVFGYFSDPSAIEKVKHHLSKKYDWRLRIVDLIVE